MANITNAEVDAFCAAIPVSWFGPATRVTNVESPQLTNTNDFTITVAYGDGDTTSVTLNYDELIDADEYKPIVFGAVIDDFAAAVDAPYGPIVRNTTLANLGTDAKSAFDEPISFTLASPYDTASVELSYNELKYEAVVLERLQRAVGVQYQVNRLKTEIAALYAVSNALIAPHTEDDYQELIDGIRDLNYSVGGFKLN